MMKEIRKIALMAVGDEAWIGGIQYITNILDGLNAAGAEKNLEIHVFKSATQKLYNLGDFKNISIHVEETEKVLPPFSPFNRIGWLLKRKLQGRVYPRFEDYLIRNGFDYVYPATLSDCGGRLNVGSWIADFQYHNFPDGHSADTTREAESHISFIAHKMPKVVLSSHFCESDCYRLFPVTKGKSHVMPFTVYIREDRLDFSDFGTIRNKYGIEGPFLMVSNLFGAIKNHKTLFAALGILKKKGLVIPLVCTGNLVNYAKMEFTNEILQVITDTGIRHQLYLLGLIPREDQLALYRMSVAMVQPSLHEGWSTCVEEARALGKTLVLSDIDVHKEQYPDNPFFFKADDPADLASKLEEVYTRQSGQSFPEMEKERQAFRAYREEVKAFGLRFLQIAAS
jgi:glycosyltransferase involved in cell wall biosynthesis